MNKTIPQLKKNRFAYLALLFFLLDVGYFFLLKSNQISKASALYETITSFVLILFFSFILQRIHSFYHSRSAINNVHLSIILIFSFLSTLFLHEYGHWIYSQDAFYKAFLENSFFIRWLILFLIYMAAVNQFWIDKHIIEEANSVERLLEKERQLLHSEMKNLQEQFQPHFLFNSLNSISALVKMEPEQARTMIQNLSDYLRLTIQKSNEEMVSIEDELKYLNLYLSIEKVRFGHRLEIKTELEKNCLDKKIPVLMLQPLIENAIKFGLYGNIGKLEISISVTCKGSDVKITIKNPFDATQENKSKGTGYGLQAIDRKLQWYFKRNDLLTTNIEDSQFITTLKIPQL